MRILHRTATGRFVPWQLPVHEHFTRKTLLCLYESLYIHLQLHSVPPHLNMIIVHELLPLCKLNGKHHQQQ